MIYTRCLTDTGLFATLFFPDHVKNKCSELHADLLTWMADFRRGIKRSLAAPRDNAKSTYTSFIKPLHRIAYSLERYIVLIGDTDKAATDRVLDIRNELEHNKLYREVYGDLVNKDHWLKTDIVTANDIRVQGFAVRTSIRGTKHKSWRPTLIIYDDVESRKLVKSPENRADQWDWFTKDTLRAGQMGYTNYDFVGTVLHPDSLLANLLKNPAWKGEIFKAVKSWPSDQAQVYWNRWREIYTDLANPLREEDADDYYARHEEAMLDGVEVLWPDRQPFVELQKIIVSEGMASFNTELQNNPIGADTSVFDMANALRFHVQGDMIVRRDGRMVKLSGCRKYAYHDPAFGKTVHGDYACIVVIAVDDFGYVYVIDAWIDRKPPSFQIQKAFELSEKWGFRAMGLEINNGWELLEPMYEEERRKRAHEGEFCTLVIQKVHNSDNKDDRIATMEVKIANRWIGFNDGLPVIYMEQMTQWPTSAKDDGPDATEGAIRTASTYETLFGGMLDKKVA